MSFRRRLISALGANSVSQVVSISIQVGSVPVLLGAWGLETYGYWLLLAAVPSYFAMADAGYISVAINRMSILVAGGDLSAARVTFQTALALAVSVTVGAGILGATASFVLPMDMLDIPNYRLALALLIFSALLALSVGLIDAVFRACGEYARGIYLINAIRVAEWLGLLIGVLLVGSILAAAIGMLVGRALSTILVILYAADRHPSFRWSARHATKHELKIMAVPALTFLGFPVGNAISIQGLTLAVGLLLGPAALASFAIYRTVARTLTQLTALLSRSLWPEISLLFGRGRLDELRKMYRWSSSLVLLGSLIASGLIFTAGPLFIEAWTAGKVAWDPSLLAGMLGAVVAGSMWQTGMVLLSATNQHSGFALQYLLACVLSVPVALVAMSELGIMGAVVGMISLELALAVLAHVSATKFLRRSCAHA